MKQAIPGCERQDEQGGALAFVLIVMTGLLFVGSMSLSMSLGGRRASVNKLHGKRAQACAEVALERARLIAATNRIEWDAVLAPGTTAWYGANGITGTCPGPGEYTYQVTIRDNVDDTGSANDPTSDKDSSIILDAVALKGTMEVAKLSGLINATGTPGPEEYKGQVGLGARGAYND